MSNHRPAGYARSWVRAALPVAGILLVIGSARANDPAVPVDRYGDSLDAGAMQRLGTVRYQVDGAKTALAFGRGNRTLLIATATAPFPLTLLDTPTGKHIGRIDTGNSAVQRLCVSEDRQFLTTLELIPNRRDTYYVLRRRELEAGKVLVEVRLPSRQVGEFAATADGALALTGEPGGAVRIWDMIEGKQLRDQNLARAITAVAISEGTDLAVIATTGRESHELHFWKWRNADGPTASMPVHQAVQTLSFSPDGAWLAEGPRGGPGVVVRDARTREQKHLLTVPDKSFLSVASLEFSPDGHSLACAGKNVGKMTDRSFELRHCLWDVRTGEVKQARSKPGIPALSMLSGVPLAWSRDGRSLASLDDQSRILVLDTETGKALNDAVEGDSSFINAIRLTRDGATAVTAGFDDRLRIWDVATGRVRHAIRHDGGGIDALALSPDDRWIASMGMDDTLRVCDMATGQEKFKHPGRGNADRPRALAFLADGRTLASWGPDSILGTFDIETGGTLNQRPLGPDQIRDAVKGRPEIPIRNEQFRLHHAAFSGDGTVLAITEMQSVVLFDVQTGRFLRAFHDELPIDRRASLALSPDGKLVGWGAFSLADKAVAVRFREMATGKESFAISPPDGTLGRVAFSPDGRIVAVAFQSQARELVLHDAATGERLRTISGLKAIPTALALSGSGSRLACGLADGTALVWDLTVPKSP